MVQQWSPFSVWHPFLLQGQSERGQTTGIKKKPLFMPHISEVITRSWSASTGHRFKSLGIKSVTHLDWGSSKMRQLFNVLTLLSYDGSHCEWWDEKVYRLRLLGSLLGSSMLVPQWTVDHRQLVKTTHTSQATDTQMQTEVLAKAAQFKARVKLHLSRRWKNSPTWTQQPVKRHVLKC